MDKIIVTDDSKKVTDISMLSHLATNYPEIDPQGVEFFQDYAIKGEEKSPYSKHYRDLNSDLRFAVISQLPMVDADGNKNIPGWNDNGSIQNPRYTEKANLYHASVDGTKVTIQVKNDQPNGTKQGDKVTFNPVLVVGGIVVSPVDTDAAIIDGGKTLEWDYIICKRRLRQIQGKILGSWVFSSNPDADIQIRYNQSGDFKLRLGQFSTNEDTESVSLPTFNDAIYPFIISDTATFYPDATESTTVDGYVFRSTTNESWATLRSGAGTTADIDLNIYASYMLSGSSNDTWNLIIRSITLFNTSSLGAGVTVSAWTLSVYGSAKADVTGIGDGLVANVYTTSPASNTNLVTSDFNIANWGSTALATGITYTNWSTAAYNVFTGNDNSVINKTGITKLGFRSTYDATNTAPTWPGSTLYEYMQGYAAETGGDFRPRLVVTYSTVAPKQLKMTSHSRLSHRTRLFKNISLGGG